MRIDTKYFGAVELDAADLLLFEEGMFGFEEEKRFVLIPFSSEDDCLLCLQSVQTPALAFTVVNPFFFWPDYQPRPAAADLLRLGVGEDASLCYYAMCIVRDPVAESTANLRCPIVIDDATRRARQVMLDGYEMRCRLPLAEGGAR